MSNLKKYFVTGIDTDIGKTIVAAVLTEALKADYWKPIQSGDLDNSDTLRVRNLISNKVTKFHPNSYAFSVPASPHLSANLDNQSIDIQNITLNNCSNNLIVEGAGGLLVPLNESDLILDLIKRLNYEVIVVIKNYLGSINHSLLTLEILRLNNVRIKGIIINGDDNESSESFIEQYTNIPCLGRVPQLDELNKNTIREIAKKFNYLNYE